MDIESSRGGPMLYEVLELVVLVLMEVPERVYTNMNAVC